MYSGDTQNTSFGLYPHMDMSLSKCGSVCFRMAQNGNTDPTINLLSCTSHVTMIVS